MAALSRIEDILDAYEKGVSYDKKPLSRVEMLLLNVLFGASYEVNAPLSRIEEQLMDLETYDGPILSRIEEILRCKIIGTEYTGDTLSRIEGTEKEIVIGDWDYPTIDDNFGDPILDFNGNEILSRVRAA